MEKAESILIEIFKKRFKEKSLDLIRKDFARQEVKEYSTLEPKEQVAIGCKAIEHVYGKLLEKDVVEHMKVVYVLKFAIANATEIIKTMIQKTVSLDLKPLVENTVGKASVIGKQIKNPMTTKFCFECSGLLDGLLVISIETDVTVSFAKTLMVLMMGTYPEDDNLDTDKLTAVYEFFNVLFPDLLDVVGEAFDNSLFFTPLFFADMESRYYTKDGKLNVSKSTYTSSVTIKIDETEVVGKIFFLLK